MPDTASNPHQILRERYSIFEKDGVFGLVALGITPSVNVVARYDPRVKPTNSFKGFETPAQAEHWFEEYTIATVQNNLWTISGGI